MFFSKSGKNPDTTSTKSTLLNLKKLQQQYHFTNPTPSSSYSSTFSRIPTIQRAPADSYDDERIFYNTEEELEDRLLQEQQQVPSSSSHPNSGDYKMCVK